MLQAASVDSPQGPRALAGGEQVFLAAALVADPAHWPVIEGAAGGEGRNHWSARRAMSLFLRASPTHNAGNFCGMCAVLSSQHSRLLG